MSASLALFGVIRFYLNSFSFLLLILSHFKLLNFILIINSVLQQSSWTEGPDKMGEHRKKENNLAKIP